MTTRSSELRRRLLSPEPLVVMEAHNGLTARLVEDAGFDAIWASGLCIAASLGVRDCNEASWTQVLEVVEFMADAVSVPVLMDGDTGYGDFNNLRRFIARAERLGIAGVCVEDKRFPKTNSFLDRSRQQLAPIDEFCGKIRAARSVCASDDFVFIARTEAFIAGLGAEVALERAHAYVDAGADAILVHSKRDDAADIRAFMADWDGAAPVVVVPTTYPQVEVREFLAMGVTNVIYANQTLRTVIRAVEENLRTLRAAASASSIEHRIAPLSEVFRLQDAGELDEARARFSPKAPSTEPSE